MLACRLLERLEETRDSRSDPAEVSQSEAQRDGWTFRTASLAAPNFALLRLLLAAISLSGHKWQCPQSCPCPHPSGFQNHMQGLHIPVPWGNEPWLGRPKGGGRPGGGGTDT